MTDLSTPTSGAHAVAGSGTRSGRTSDRAIGLWLLGCAVLVFAMVVVGGITRLSHAGLSIVEWKLVTGVLPPLSEAAWNEAFEAYKAFPEYQQINRGMSLAEFREIYWLEWAHRLLGRFLGIAFAVPLAFFAIAGRLSRPWMIRMGGLLVLGGLQGVLGWYMVKSGLVDQPDVSHYRLAAHMGLAVVLYAALVWCAFTFLGSGRIVAADRGLARRGAGVAALVFLTLISGAFVAGLDAGFLYNTFPLMGGQWVPPDVLALDPWYLNPLENRATVQFQHRVLALITLAAVVALYLAARRHGTGDRAGVVLAAALTQVALGIATLLLSVPVVLGVLHQAMAVLLLTAALWFSHGHARPPAAPGRGR